MINPVKVNNLQKKIAKWKILYQIIICILTETNEGLLGSLYRTIKINFQINI